MTAPRAADQLRPISIETGFLSQPDGCALISFGQTRVLCCASVDERVPQWMAGRGKGWVTAEYSLLPGSTRPRSSREAARGRIGGRTYEIQRLIGRSLRMAVDMKKLGERQIWIDCDVLQADGGTRTAAITGGWVALKLAVEKLLARGTLKKNPLKAQVAAISVGIVSGSPVLDLNYQQDSNADVDMNFVMNDSLQLLEIQGTAESAPFDSEQLGQMTGLAEKGIRELLQAQSQAF